MGRRARKRDLMKHILQAIFQGRRLVKTGAKNEYLVLNYEGDLRHLRMLAKRAKELRWGEIVEEKDGIRYRLLEVGAEAYGAPFTPEEIENVRQGL